MTQVNSLPDGKYISYAADGDNRWKDGIFNNIHVSTSEEQMSEGLHKVSIYGMHAEMCIRDILSAYIISAVVKFAAYIFQSYCIRQMIGDIFHYIYYKLRHNIFIFYMI